MALTLSKLLQRVYTDLGTFTVSKATSGTTVTLLDSKLNEVYGDDVLKGGAVFVIKDSGGESDAPEGEFEYITGNTGGTFTLNFSTLTAAPASGDTYAFADPVFNIYKVIEIVNNAFDEIGYVDRVDTTTLDTAANQTEYACQTAWKHNMGPKRIDVQGKTSDANDNRWRTLPRDQWEYIPASAGSTGLIVSREQWLIGRDIRVWYEDSHERVDAYDDEIEENWDPDLVVKTVVRRILKVYNAENEGTDRYRKEQQNQATDDLQIAKLEKQPVRVARKPKLLIIGGAVEEENLSVPTV